MKLLFFIFALFANFCLFGQVQTEFITSTYIRGVEKSIYVKYDKKIDRFEITFVNHNLQITTNDLLTVRITDEKQNKYLTSIVDSVKITPNTETFYCSIFLLNKANYENVDVFTDYVFDFSYYKNNVIVTNRVTLKGSTLFFIIQDIIIANDLIYSLETY
jgi:hypothetical protein